MDALTDPRFDAERDDPAVRDFYERTAAYRMDVWSRTHFPAHLALLVIDLRDAGGRPRELDSSGEGFGAAGFSRRGRARDSRLIARHRGGVR